MLAATPLSKALLLQFFAQHADQVARIVVTVPAGEMPELWSADFAGVTQASTSFPRSPAPMARILSVDGLAGMPVGPGQVTLEVVRDPFIAGRYMLDGTAGGLEVQRGGASAPGATLTAAGLSGLVYGVLDPDDLSIRGFGEVRRDAAARLRTLFPRTIPYLHATF